MVAKPYINLFVLYVKVCVCVPITEKSTTWTAHCRVGAGVMYKTVDCKKKKEKRLVAEKKKGQVVPHFTVRCHQLLILPRRRILPYFGADISVTWRTVRETMMMRVWKNRGDFPSGLFAFGFPGSSSRML